MRLDCFRFFQFLDCPISTLIMRVLQMSQFSQLFRGDCVSDVVLLWPFSFLKGTHTITSCRSNDSPYVRQASFNISYLVLEGVLGSMSSFIIQGGWLNSVIHRFEMMLQGCFVIPDCQNNLTTTLFSLSVSI